MKVLHLPPYGQSMPANSTGLNAELNHCYPNGRNIRTTSVHPTWANTPLLARVKDSLDKVKVEIIPPEDVVDVVVKQILSGKGAQLFIPPNQARQSNIRGWPNWLQELGRGAGAKTLKDAEG